MPEYTDPERLYTLEYPEGWLTLTHEGTPHVSLASLTTGGYLKIEAYEFEHQPQSALEAKPTLQALLEADRQNWPELEIPGISCRARDGMQIASSGYTRVEPPGEKHMSDFGHLRAWVFTRGTVQIRCVYRCRSSDEGVDDDDLEGIIGSVNLTNVHHLDASSFVQYYHCLLKLRRPRLAGPAPEKFSLILADGQTILLEQLFHHYLQEPERMDELIDAHIELLDFCGDDVPDLSNYKAVKPLLFPKLFPSNGGPMPAHRCRCWPSMTLGAVIQGTVFNYGVNQERLNAWGFKSLNDIRNDLLENLYAISPVPPRGLQDDEGQTRAISYVDHPFAASFVLFADFYETTAHNLNTEQFLVGLPDPSCVSCFRNDDPRFVVEHTAMLRWDYHRSAERLTDTIYLVTGPALKDIKPYDILHCCVKKVAVG